MAHGIPKRWYNWRTVVIVCLAPITTQQLSPWSCEGRQKLHDPYEGNLNIYLQSNEQKEKNTYNRFHTRLISYCSEHYYFKMSKRVTNLYGYKKLDGTMDGLVGELERRRADFGLSPLFIRKDRASVITYGRQTWLLRSAFVFRNPKSKNSFELFVRPLSLPVWIMLFGFFILAVLVLKWNNYFDNQRNSLTDPSWSFSMLCLVGAFCQQGINAAPTLLSGKTGIAFTLLLTTMIYQFYSGSLVSSLLNVPLVLINNVDDLLNSNLKVRVEDVRFNKEYFKYTTDVSSLKLYQKWILGKEDKAYLKPTDGLNLLKTGGQYAFHVELAKSFPFIKSHFKEQEVCELTQVPMFKPTPCYANYVKHSPFRDIFDICLHRIAESGVLQKELKFWHADKPDCVYGFNISTGLDEFYPVLFLLGVGVIISVNIMLLEICCSRRQRKKKAPN